MRNKVFALVENMAGKTVHKLLVMICFCNGIFSFFELKIPELHSTVVVVKIDGEKSHKNIQRQKEGGRDIFIGFQEFHCGKSKKF